MLAQVTDEDLYHYRMQIRTKEGNKFIQTSKTQIYSEIWADIRTPTPIIYSHTPIYLSRRLKQMYAFICTSVCFLQMHRSILRVNSSNCKIVLFRKANQGGRKFCSVPFLPTFEKQVLFVIDFSNVSILFIQWIWQSLGIRRNVQ